MSIPTLLVFENGQVVNKLIGFRPKRDILAEIGV
jgi:thioredoxin 1